MEVEPLAAAPVQVNAGATLPHSAKGALRSMVRPLYAPTSLDDISLGISLPVLPLFILELGTSEAATGAAVSALGLGRMLWSVPAGRLVSLVGEKRSVQLGLLLGAMSSLMLGVV